MDIRVAVTEPEHRKAEGVSSRAREVNGFEEAVNGPDVVSLHLPAVLETHHDLNRSRIETPRAGCVLINTARGALVDEIALFDALSSERLGGAALDVFDREPYQPLAPEKDLRRLSSVALTPRTGSSTREACDRMARRALQNIQLAVARRFLEMDLRNPAVLACFQR